MAVPVTGQKSTSHWPHRLRVALPLLVAVASFVLSAALIRRYPVMYWYDPYGRVAGRDHILRDRWLPLLQLVIWWKSFSGKLYRSCWASVGLAVPRVASPAATRP